MRYLFSTLFIFGLAAAHLEGPNNDKDNAPYLAPRSFPVYSYSADVNSYAIANGFYDSSSGVAGGYSSSAAAGVYSSSAAAGVYSSVAAQPSNRPQNNPNPRPSSRPQQQQGGNGGNVNNDPSGSGTPQQQPGDNGAAGVGRWSAGALVGMGALTGFIAVML